MARRKPRAEAPGQDSFLDIVANLVGILIILVMVVGARAKDAWVDSSQEPDSTELTKLEDDVQNSQKATESIEQNINLIAAKSKIQQASVAARKSERDRFLLAVTAVERELERRRSELDSSSRQSLELRRDLSIARNELQTIQRQRSVVENSAAESIVIEHIPTPMAKTVFGKEVHFRLLGGRLVHVPLDALIERMKDEIGVKVEKLRNASQTIETVGPIGGFHLRYLLRLSQQVQTTQFGDVKRDAPEFAGFYLQPVSGQIGEPFQEALSPGSKFMSTIEGLNPDATTITVWVYPDSFNEFLVLKREMFQRGFLTASWPLPFDQPISGSPHGKRSSAQ